MGFSRPESWVWDFWLADDGERYHLFHLHAPKTLGDPDLRHRNARVGHASSTDLMTWETHDLALAPGAEGGFDGTATWTGSVVHGPDGLWRMFYTGSRFLSPDTSANVETIGVATSADLFTWEKQPGPICSADARWYETLGSSDWPEEAWRDPWVFEHEGLWHMLVTARANAGDLMDRGVVGYATSSDLATWEVQPPLSAPGGGFAHLEVTQIVTIGGRHYMIFCCDTSRLGGHRTGDPGGVWYVMTDSVLGPYRAEDARLLASQDLYAGRLVQDRAGRWMLMAFNFPTADGIFDGSLCDPIPVLVDEETGALSLRKDD